MRIGVVSDNHGYFDPRVHEALSDVEVILHAGDVGSQSVLDALAEIAPVLAVRGNVDSVLLNLPPSRQLTLHKVQIEMLHILPSPQSSLSKWARTKELAKAEGKRKEAFQRSFADATHVVIFGHSHEPCLVTLGQKLFFNPGSAGRPRFSLPCCCGLLEISSDELRATVVTLGRYNGDLPEEVRLPLGVKPCGH